jgi:glycosyltransferase involved in cell wall biosynthesis
MTSQKVLEPAGNASVRAKQLRLALICDFVEENWPSMDLVGDMLFDHLVSEHAPELAVTKVRPSMRCRFRRISMPGAAAALENADRCVNRFVDYPFWLRRRRAQFDLFHIVDHSYSQLVHHLPPGRTIVTCHDLDTFRCLLEPESEKRPRWFRAMMQRVLDGFRLAAHIITVSSATRDDVLRHRLCPPERVSVVHNGVHPSCSPAANATADAVAARLLPNDAIGTQCLLNVGSTIRRKRIDILLRVFAAVRHELPQVRLIHAGAGMTHDQLQIARELKIENAVIELPPLTRDVLAAIYRRADLLLHTAEAEGFGLPLIEAMACGCPVIASDMPVLREVAGSAGTYCQVADVSAWKDTVIRLLDEKEQRKNAWEERRKQAIARASRFSWTETAQQTARIYTSVLQ